MIHVTIDTKPYEFEESITIFEAAKQTGTWIPTLCYNEKLKPYGGCRLCLVELTGRPVLVPSCSTYITEGMDIQTNTERVKKGRKFVASLLLARVPESEEMKEVAKKVGVERDNEESLDLMEKYLFKKAEPPFETNCILCGLCVRVCAEITERNALSFSERGIVRRVKTPFEKVAETCIGCGSCAYVCPTKTITIEEA